MIWIWISVILYWLIGVLFLRYCDPWDLGSVIAMCADSRHRNLWIAFFMLIIGWFTWPIQLILLLVNYLRR
jgi:hypothetical protein